MRGFPFVIKGLEQAETDVRNPFRSEIVAAVTLGVVAVEQSKSYADRNVRDRSEIRKETPGRRHAEVQEVFPIEDKSVSDRRQTEKRVLRLVRLRRQCNRSLVVAPCHSICGSFGAGQAESILKIACQAGLCGKPLRGHLEDQVPIDVMNGISVWTCIFPPLRESPRDPALIRMQMEVPSSLEKPQ